jgi:hypothetical protein
MNEQSAEYFLAQLIHELSYLVINALFRSSNGIDKSPFAYEQESAFGLLISASIADSFNEVTVLPFLSTSFITIIEDPSKGQCCFVTLEAGSKAAKTQINILFINKFTKFNSAGVE